MNIEYKWWCNNIQCDNALDLTCCVQYFISLEPSATVSCSHHLHCLSAARNKVGCSRSTRKGRMWSPALNLCLTGCSSSGPTAGTHMKLNQPTPLGEEPREWIVVDVWTLYILTNSLFCSCKTTIAAFAKICGRGNSQNGTRSNTHLDPKSNKEPIFNARCTTIIKVLKLDWISWWKEFKEHDRRYVSW